MLLGNITAQMITLMSAPIITRLYTPDDFGVLTLVWSYVGILSVIACLRFDQAVVIENHDADAINLVFICMLLTGVLTLSLCILVACAAQDIAKLIKLPKSLFYLWYIPAGFAAFGVNSTLTHWFARQKKFSYIAIGRVTGALASAVLKISFGFFLFSSATWLVTGNIVALALPGCILAVVFFYYELKPFPFVDRNRLWRPLVQKYRDFPTYHAASGIINSASQNIPIILLAHFYSPAIIGFYGLSNTVLRRPIEIVSQSLSKVYLQKVAEEYHAGNNLRKNYIRTTVGLLIAGLFPFALLGFFGESIFTFLFGPQWGTAGIYTQILAPWLFLAFINPPATQIIIVKQRFRFNFVFNILSLVLRILSIGLPAMLSMQPTHTLLIFSATSVLTNLVYILYAFKQTSAAA